MTILSDTDPLTLNEARTFADLGVPESLLAQLFIKHSFFREFITSREMSDALKIPEHLVERIIEYLKGQKYLDIKPPGGLRPQGGHLAVEVRYASSGLGERRAGQRQRESSLPGG